jgi:hypothetical protein
MVPLVITTTILMFLAFGSLVLPIKAAVMSALTVGSTLGILTWMFVDGHGSGLINYTPQPLLAPMIGLIIAVIWGCPPTTRCSWCRGWWRPANAACPPPRPSGSAPPPRVG